MCSYRERKSDPIEMMQLDGFTVDFCEPSTPEGSHFGVLENFSGNSGFYLDD